MYIVSFKVIIVQEGQPSVENLNEMQCMWFLTECARTYYSTKDYANTLKK